MKKIISGVITSLKTSIRNEWDTWWENEFSTAVPEHYKPYTNGISMFDSLSIVDVKAQPYWRMAHRAIDAFQFRLYQALLMEYNNHETYDHAHFTGVLNEVYGDQWRAELQEIFDGCGGEEWEHREACDTFVRTMLETFLEQLVEIMTSEWSEAFYFGFFEELDGITQGLQSLGILGTENRIRCLCEDPQCRICVLETDDVTYTGTKVWDGSPDAIEWVREGIENAHLTELVWLVNDRIETNMKHRTLENGDIIKKCVLKPRSI